MYSISSLISRQARIYKMPSL
jgi:drug/metabolite transporter (DMT)-like permease